MSTEYTQFEVLKNEQTPEVPVMSVEDIKSCKVQNDINGIIHFAENYKELHLAGLAANQLGEVHGERVKHRFCIVRQGQDGPWAVAFNPEIVETGGKQFDAEEGCATWPNKIVVSKRWEQVTIKFLDRDGEECTGEAIGFEAQVWQHEIDHLNGITEYLADKPTKPTKTIVNDEPKLGRNDPCSCGSGKKYKKCCA